jgi:MFS family permease
VEGPSEELELEEDQIALGPRARAGRAIRSLAVDVTPLKKHRDYRLLFEGLFVSEIGHQITHVAILIQVFAITHSTLAVGLVGLAALVPLALSTIGFAWIADAFDRRRVLALIQVGLAFGSGVLLLNSLSPHPSLAVIYVAVGITAFLGGIDSPTRTAAVAHIVGPEQLTNAVALNQVLWNTAMVAGPALGGLLAARSFPLAYGVDAATYGATFLAAILMRPIRPAPGDAAPTRGMKAIREGFAYLKGRRVIQTTFSVDLIAMIFGMPRALFPVLALTQFNEAPRQAAHLVGFMLAAIGAGALIGALTTGWVQRVRHQGRAVLWAITVWGAAIVGFGLVGDHIVLALLCLAVAGGADVISAVFRGTILQLAVPDSLRGRLNGIHILVVTGGPRLGDVEAGLVADLWSPMASVVSGGLACIVGMGVIALLVPEFARYHAGEPDHPVGSEEPAA